MFEKVCIKSRYILYVMLFIVNYSFVVSLHSNGRPHTAYGILQNFDSTTPAVDEIRFNAYILLRPSEILTESSTGCGFESGYWSVSVGNFSSAWSAGDILYVEFYHVNDNVQTSVQLIMTNDDPNVAELAVFPAPQVNQNTLDINILPQNSGTTDPSIGTHVYNEGTEVTITATPSEGYVFVNWTGDVTNSNSASTTVTMDGNQTVTANFKPVTRTLTIAGSPAEKGTTIPEYGEYAYDHGTTVNISATPVSGWRFVKWTGDVSDPNSPNTTVFMDGDQTITATFEEIPPNQYVLSITVTPQNSGTTDPSIGTHVYNEGAEVNITATPSEGYVFVSWTGDVTNSNSACTSVNMNNQKNVTAVFKQQREITINSNPSGLIIKIDDMDYVTPINITRNRGDVVSIEAETLQSVGEGSRYHFNRWSHGQPASHLFTVSDSNSILTAMYFTEYELSVASEHNSVTGSGWYKTGEIATFSISSRTKMLDKSERHLFISWLGSGEDAYSGSDTVYSIQMAGPVTEIAQWDSQYFLSLEIDPISAGYIQSSSSETWFNKGEKVDIIANPYKDQSFIGWGGDLDGNINPTSIVMDEPKLIIAYFGVMVDVTIQTVPSGLTYVFDGESYLTKKTIQVLKNSTHRLSIKTIEEEEENSHYSFDEWEGEIENKTDRILEIESDTSFVAVFKREYYLDVISSFGRTYGSGWYRAGATAKFGVVSSLICVEDGERNCFNHWTTSSRFGYAGNDSSVQMIVNGPTIQTAYWDTLYLLSTLTNPGSGGGIVRIPNKFWFYPNELVQLIIKPNLNNQFLFSGWRGDIESEQDTLNFAMNKPIVVTANFQKLSYLIQSEVLPLAQYGKIIKEPDLESYSPGTIVKVQAVANSGYIFDHWEGDIVGCESDIEVVVNGDVIINPCFKKQDTSPPELTNIYPKPNAVGILINSDIEFRISDDVYGLDTSSIDISLNGMYLVQSGVDLTNGKIIINSSGEFWQFKYVPDTPYDMMERVMMKIACCDLAVPYNDTTFTYYFTTGGAKEDKLLSKEISSSGGVIKEESGVQIVVPQGALPEDATISIGRVENSPDLPDTLKGIGVAYHFGPDGFLFNLPITMTLPYTEKDLMEAGVLNENDIKIYYYSTSEGRWIELNILSLDQSNKKLSINIDHFSYFQIAMKTDSKKNMTLNSFASIYNYPNPFNPDKSETVIAFQLKTDDVITIKIYNSLSELVRVITKNRSIQGNVLYRDTRWDGRNESGSVVSNNVYYCMLETGNGKKKFGKIAVVR